MAASSDDVEHKCFVEGLALTTDDYALQKAFSEFGEVTAAKIIHDPETGSSKGNGFVTYKTEQAMHEAIKKMNGQTLDGQQITVKGASGSGGVFRRVMWPPVGPGPILN